MSDSCPRQNGRKLIKGVDGHLDKYTGEVTTLFLVEGSRISQIH